MTAAAVRVGGLALWRGHPAGAQVSSVVRASGRRLSILQVYLSSSLRLSVRAYSERETGLAGWKLYMPPGMCAVIVGM